MKGNDNTFLKDWQINKRILKKEYKKKDGTVQESLKTVNYPKRIEDFGIPVEVEPKTVNKFIVTPAGDVSLYAYVKEEQEVLRERSKIVEWEVEGAPLIIERTEAEGIPSKRLRPNLLNGNDDQATNKFPPLFKTLPIHNEQTLLRPLIKEKKSGFY